MKKYFTVFLSILLMLNGLGLPVYAEEDSPSEMEEESEEPAETAEEGISLIDHMHY